MTQRNRYTKPFIEGGRAMKSLDTTLGVLLLLTFSSPAFSANIASQYFEANTLV
ncbi:MAG: hypothetical protein ACPGYT_03240 [Nitrospirales bacterium]